MNRIFYLTRFLMAVFWEIPFLVQSVGYLFKPRHTVSQLTIIAIGTAAGYWSYSLYIPGDGVFRALFWSAHCLGIGLYNFAILLGWIEDNAVVHGLLAVFAGMAIGLLAAAAR